jgi:hypothetical protein
MTEQEFSDRFIIPEALPIVTFLLAAVDAVFFAAWFLIAVEG